MTQSIFTLFLLTVPLSVAASEKNNASIIAKRPHVLSYLRKREYGMLKQDDRKFIISHQEQRDLITEKEKKFCDDMCKHPRIEYCIKNPSEFDYIFDNYLNTKQRQMFFWLIFEQSLMLRFRENHQSERVYRLNMLKQLHSEYGCNTNFVTAPYGNPHNPLQEAVIYRDVEAVNILLAMGADKKFKVNGLTALETLEKRIEGNTPLACENELLDILK